MKWIAVDYGERRTGLAVCDASELIVTPVTPQIEEKSLNKVAEAAAAARLARRSEAVDVQYFLSLHHSGKLYLVVYFHRFVAVMG